MIIQLDEAKRTLLAMKDDVKELASALKIEKIKDDAEELEQKTMVPNFWDDAANSSKILRELKQIKDTLEEYEELKTALEFQNADDAFDCAIGALKQTLTKLGFHEEENKVWKK